MERISSVSHLALDNSEIKKDNLRSASRTDAQIRTGLLSRLTYEKIWLKPADRPKIS